jgi:hypothetical protein
MRDPHEPADAVSGARDSSAGRKLSCSDLALFVLAALLPFSPFAAFGARADASVGQPAPDFAFQGSDGKAYTLSGVLESGTGGVVLAFFPKAFTPG